MVMLGKQKKRNGKRVLLGFAFFACLFLLPAFRPTTQTACVNAGPDARIDPFGVVCWLQQHYSFKSAAEPRLHTHGYWAWGRHPLYFVYNWRRADGSVLVLRVGWRYDVNWRGYIGPSAAFKTMAEPLLYY